MNKKILNNHHLIIFVKNPVLGKVKTRIGKEVGDEKALEIYKILLEHTQNICQDISVKKKLYYSSFIDNNDHWNGTQYDKKLQSGLNLGERMYNAIHEESEKAKKIVLIGSDNGELNATIINAAFESLDNNDIVLGPANDGGYYLVGMRSSQPIFDDITWSSNLVLDQTISIINKLELTYVLLPYLNDIDYYEDWKNWVNTNG